MHSLVASPYKSAYNAAKHGVSRYCGAHCRHCPVLHIQSLADAHINVSNQGNMSGCSAGIAGFTKTVALETAKGTGVTCNAICPGYMFTALVQNQLEDTARIRGISKVLPITGLWQYMADNWEGRRFARSVWFATSWASPVAYPLVGLRL